MNGEVQDLIPPARFLASLLLVSSPVWPQNAAIATQLGQTQSIGDAVRRADSRPKPVAAAIAPQESTTRAVAPVDVAPIHILYMHGINQVGAGDSFLLRQGICKYLGECTATPSGRIYADGPFAVDAAPPALAYMQSPIWKTKEEWSASAPFIERYRISGNGHVPILLDELNWFPLAYPLKCKALIARDALLTGPSQSQLEVCEAPPCTTTPEACKDPAHPGRFLKYQWIRPQEAAKLNNKPRHATFANRSLKNGLMDWGFGDAVMALGPMGDILCAGIRELLVKSLQSPDVDFAPGKPEDSPAEAFFVTHSLGSYLALAALDSDWLGGESQDVPQFQITPEQKNAADYFSAHTAGFYFLANQIALLELSRVRATVQPADVCDATPAGNEAPVSISHWQCRRELYLKQRSETAQGPQIGAPQIVAWSDPNDLLSWNVPQIGGVKVVNISVGNSGFKIPPFIVWPTGAHGNYADNKKVLRLIFKPSEH